ncbi:unnamed protein product [Penicillium nalgiovense]|nr:unnamed protein product [Penicillium nalgiovense]
MLPCLKGNTKKGILKQPTIDAIRGNISDPHILRLTYSPDGFRAADRLGPRTSHVVSCSWSPRIGYVHHHYNQLAPWKPVDDSSNKDNIE